MYFLIDYENVGSLGLRGSEFLVSSDHVILFYSASAPHMEHRHWENICKSGCGFEVCTLFKQRKNGLDFYIATKVGELFGAERTKHAVIVSNDTGFQRCAITGRSAPAHRTASHSARASNTGSSLLTKAALAPQKFAQTEKWTTSQAHMPPYR